MPKLAPMRVRTRENYGAQFDLPASYITIDHNGTGWSYRVRRTEYFVPGECQTIECNILK